MKLYIKNMVCSRCILVVRSELEKLGLTPVHVALGEVELSEENIDSVKPKLMGRLDILGFELIDDRKSRTIEKIKTLIIDLVHHKNNNLSTNLSDYLAQELNHDYSALSTLFSEVENTTIEKFYIHQKIEKVKELITYDELTLNEIADLLRYSSAAHLSNQFKKVTGFSPSYFKQLKENKRKKIEDL
jgi:AraC-like DNA-binding protein